MWRSSIDSIEKHTKQEIRLCLKKMSRKKVSKKLGIGYGINRKRVSYSFVLALLLTAMVIGIRKWDYISAFVFREPPPSYLILEKRQFNYGRDDIDRYIEQGCYVPNYDADVYISLRSERVSVGGSVQCRIWIVDKGIVELDKPYFYALFVNSKDEVVSTFPYIGQVSVWSKMPWWITYDHGDFYSDCLRVESGDQTYHVPRETLLEGFGRYVYAKGNTLYWTDSPCNVYLELPTKDDPSQIGRWRIYVFLHDEEYVDRLGAGVSTVNFVSFQIAEFDVLSKEPPKRSQETINEVVYGLLTLTISFVFTYWGIYSQIEKHKTKLNRIWCMTKKHWIFLVSIAVLIGIQVWLLWK